MLHINCSTPILPRAPPGTPVDITFWGVVPVVVGCALESAIFYYYRANSQKCNTAGGAQGRIGVEQFEWRITLWCLIDVPPPLINFRKFFPPPGPYLDLPLINLGKFQQLSYTVEPFYSGHAL